MATLSLLTLVDDIASLLDDVAVMSKVAAKKTASVLGDDLALNAQQVSGVDVNRELPVIWAVTKGSLKNKLILTPAILLMTALAPWLIAPLLIVGGCYLCFEGAEKVIDYLHQKLTHNRGVQESVLSTQQPSSFAATKNIKELEQEKITGAIRTDFILSGEIIVIAIGSMQQAELITRIIAVCLVVFMMTLGVYGTVAAIVKLDDLGFFLQKKSRETGRKIIGIWGNAVVNLAPKLMRALGIIGTIAMFLVGGGIFVHNISWFHHLSYSLEQMMVSPLLKTCMSLLFDCILGLFLGSICVFVINLIKKIKNRIK